MREPAADQLTRLRSRWIWARASAWQARALAGTCARASAWQGVRATADAQKSQNNEVSERNRRDRDPLRRLTFSLRAQRAPRLLCANVRRRRRTARRASRAPPEKPRRSSDRG